MSGMGHFDIFFFHNVMPKLFILIKLYALVWIILQNIVLQIQKSSLVTLLCHGQTIDICLMLYIFKATILKASHEIRYKLLKEVKSMLMVVFNLIMRLSVEK